ncbi:MAG TPA: hypothetical protein VFT22_12075 [Kofleriaceae bacterium]|nr:hypothetical protein [Kofleriaceae bacterium]
MRARTTLVVVAMSVVFVVVALWAFARDHWGGVYDEAFIDLRYVRNLQAGCGLRFNCDGPAVEGFTGPLYLAVLWIGGLITRQLIDLTQIVGTVSLGLALVLAVVTAAVAGRHRPALQLPAVLAGSVALALALDHFVLQNAITGLETALLSAVVTALGLAAVTGRRWLLVAAICAGVLVRPEILVFAVALPILPAMRRPRYLAAVAGLVAALAIARYGVFGALAPNTHYARSGGTWRHVELGLAYILGAVADFPLAFLAPLALALPAGPLRRACGFLVAGSAAWIALLLRSGGDAFAYSRLVFPLVPVLSAVALAGIAELARRITRRELAAAITPVVCALAFAGRAAVVHTIPAQHASPRVVEWAAVGSYLRARHPAATVATAAIGAIGYYSQLPILDLTGSTEPEIARAGRRVPPAQLVRRWLGHERHCTECVLARGPALIVTTLHRDRAWSELAETAGGYYAEALLVDEIKAGRAPYRVLDAEVAPGDHVLMFERIR